MSKAKTEDKPELDRDYIETLLLEAQEQGDKGVTLTARRRAKALAVYLEGILDATR